MDELRASSKAAMDLVAGEDNSGGAEAEHDIDS